MKAKAQEIKAFIQSVIRQRRKLMREGKSQKNEMLMHKNIDHLDRYLNVYPYTSGIQMARFFLRNTDKIESLLPGTGSKDYNARHCEFLNIDLLCEDIVNPKIFIDG